MARIFMDGWEHGKPSTEIAESGIGNYEGTMWQFNQNEADSGTGSVKIVAQNTEVNEGGDFALRWYKTSTSIWTGYNCIYRELPSTYNVLYSRFYFKYKSVTPSNNMPLYNYYTTLGYGTASMRIDINSSNGTLYLLVNNATVATVSNAVTTDTWTLIEVLYDNPSSNIIIKANNSEIVNYSGTIDSLIAFVTFFKSYGSGHDDIWDFYIDDFALNDDSGTVNNSWIGAGVIRLIKPTSDDTNADFTPSTGTDNYAMVDDFPDDEDTTYNSSSTTGDIDTFILSNVPSIVAGQTINALNAVYVCKSESSFQDVAPILISGATTDTGTSESAPLRSYTKTLNKVYDVDPNTSAQWTETNVNAVKGGYKNAT
jgi:hypothetical protein